MTKEADDTLETVLNSQRQKVLDAVGDIQARAAKAKNRLPDLRKQLGDVLLSAAMGEVSSDEVSGLRATIIKAERDIEAAAHVLEPARRRQVVLDGENIKLSRRRQYRARLDELKKLIAEAAPTSKYIHHGRIDPYYVNSLRELDKAANGNTDDADRFIAGYSKDQEVA